MIDFNRLRKEKDELREKFLNAKPFPHIAIDDFLLPGCAEKLYDEAPKPDKHRHINDPYFSKNRYIYQDIDNLSENYKKFYDDALSDEFAELISYITNEEIFMDKDLHGGGVHLGVENAHLDMHADFNYHPKNKTWFRNLNLLLYLNKDWKESYGGSLKLLDARTGEKTEVQPLLNRMAIMHCRDYTIHGYDLTHFPEKMNRTSIAMYGYTLDEEQKIKPRTTIWWVEDASPFKKVLSKFWAPAVAIKKRLVG